MVAVYAGADPGEWGIGQLAPRPAALKQVASISISPLVLDSFTGN